MDYPQPLHKTLLCLKIAMIVNIIMAVLMLGALIFYLVTFLFYSPSEYQVSSFDMVLSMGFFGTMLILKSAMAVFRGILIRKLQQGIEWSRIATIIVSIVMLPPLSGIPFLSTILGAISLFGLFDRATTEYFDQNKKLTQTASRL